MPIYTYVRNVDPSNPTKAILLREGSLKLYLGTYANISNEEINEIRSSGKFVIEEGIIPPATNAGTGTSTSKATVVPNWEPFTFYLENQVLFHEGILIRAIKSFESGATYVY